MKIKYIVYTLMLLLIISCQNKDQPLISKIHELKTQPIDLFINESYFLFLSQFPQSALALDLNESISNEGLDSYDIENMESIYNYVFELQEILSSYSEENLNKHEKIQLHAYEFYIDSWLKSWDYRFHHYYFTPYYSNNQILMIVDFFINICSVESIHDADLFVRRLQNFEEQLNDLSRIIDIQESKGISLPISLINKTLRINHQFSIADLDQNVIFKSFERKLHSLDIDDETADRLLGSVRNELGDSIYPSIDLLNEKLLNQKKHRIINGVSSLPDGEQFYRFLLSSSLGVEEVDIEEIINQSIDDLDSIKREIVNNFNNIHFDNGNGNSLRALFKSLNDHQYHSSKDKPVDFSKNVIEELKSICSLYFSDFPNQNVGVEIGPDNYYIPSYSSRTEYPVFFIDPDTPQYVLKTTTAHETFPGHHFQLQSHTEMGLPQFLIYEATAGYLEGWAAYAEYLVDEIGFYDSDPYGKLGYLQTKALYISAVIVDFGIHLMNWTQEEAIQFYISNAGIDRKSAENYVLKHISDPVSRTLYYLGFREFKQLLEQEKDVMGSDFNYLQYHEKLLEYGPMPFSLLNTFVFDTNL